MRKDKYHVWQKDFESDNFKIEDIVDKANRVLIQRAYYPIEAKKVTSAIRTTNVNITKAISDLIWEKDQIELDLVISKRQLAETLIQNRIEEIKKERQQEEWKPLLSIEKILDKIFDMIPQIR